MYTGMDAIGNQMSKLRLMTGGQIELPITVIATVGGGGANAAQHSDTPYPMLMNLGGLNVAVPATPADAKGLTKTAIRSRNPCFILEPNGRGGELGEVPEGEHLVPFGKAAVRREGDAATVVAIGRMLKPALAAATALETEGISVEVLDPRTLVPLDAEAVLSSVAKTGRLIVVDEARECCSAASQIAAVVAEQGFDLLKGPIRRVTTPNVAIPYAPNAEAQVIPGEASIADAVRHLLGRSDPAGRQAAKQASRKVLA
jgi:pyruvate/2-oxoglutarate/acetoin dehydrogenase E1 component